LDEDDSLSKPRGMGGVRAQRSRLKPSPGSTSRESRDGGMSEASAAKR